MKIRDHATSLATGLLLATTLAACMQEPGSDPEELRAMRDDWQAAFESGDASRMATLYTEDGAVLPPNAGTVTGREAIGEFWAGFLEQGLGGEIRDTEVEVLGDLGYKAGTYTITDADGAAIDDGKYVEVWKRVDGAWQLHRDIFNSNRPVAAPAAEGDVARVVVTAVVEDADEWEQAFRTHGELLSSMSQSASWYGMTEDNRIAVYSEPEDLQTYMQVLESPATAEAMEMDGVDRESVAVFVLDNKFEY